METSLHSHFRQLNDPRTGNHKKHLLIDVVVLTVIAVICGAESWDSIEMFGKSKKDFLSKFLRLPNGIPSHDTINRVFSMIRPDKFELLFSQWVNSLKSPEINKEVISIDGKVIKGSKDSFHKKSPIHIVSAWAGDNQLVLGQVKVSDKSNEITAIPQLLELLDIEDCIITIDAMGTQKSIAKTIIQEGADYVLALKGNQEAIKEQVESLFERQTPEFSDTNVDKGHGRIETRKCEVITNLKFLDEKEHWTKLSSIVRITSTREIGDKISTEQRLYISSLVSNAADFNKYIRQHWGIENSLHWTLDMTFSEDYQRKRNGMASQNFALVQKMALNLLKIENSKKISIKNKRLKAAWDNNFLLKILNVQMR